MTRRDVNKGRRMSKYSRTHLKGERKSHKSKYKKRSALKNKYWVYDDKKDNNEQINSVGKKHRD
jgi:hypothetical protein